MTQSDEPIIKSLTIGGVEIPLGSAPEIDGPTEVVLAMVDALDRDDTTDFILSTTSTQASVVR